MVRKLVVVVVTVCVCFGRVGWGGGVGLQWQADESKGVYQDGP